MKETQDLDYSNLSKLLDAIPQLIEKIDKLENAQVQPNEHTEKTGLEGEIETYLGMKPPHLSSAATTIRRTIEEYCIFEKGFDLNDVFLPEKISRIDKFTAAGLEPDRIKLLDEMFEYGNQGTHNNNTEFMSEDELEKIKAKIREYVWYLNAWGMSEIDKVNGRVKYCLSQDKRLQEKLDNGELDLNSEQSQKTLGFYFRRLKEFTTSYHVDLSNIDIRFKCKQDVYDYVLDKNLKKAAGSLSFNDRSRVCSVYEKRAEQGDFGACLWMCDYHLVEKNPQKVVEYYKLALRADSAAEKIHQLSDDIRMRAGYALYQAKEYAAALKWIDNIENDVDAAILAGDCYYSNIDIKEAISRYRQIKADSLKGDKRKMLVADSLCETHPQIALQYYSLCSTAESDPEVLKRIGDCCLKLRYTEKALCAYEQALSKTYSLALKKQIAEIVANHFSWQQVKLALRMNWPQVIEKFADLFWTCEKKSLAIEWYEARGLNNLSSRVTKNVADYYLQAGAIESAVDWYDLYVSSARDYRFAKSMAKNLWIQGKSELALKLFCTYARGVNDEEAIRLLGEYYKTNNLFGQAIKWYERYYHIKKGADEETLRILIELNEKAKCEYEAFKWKRDLASLLFKKGETESAIVLYEECYKAYANKDIAKILAEYYFCHERYTEAQNMLSAYVEADVLIHKGFALVADGRLFIAHNQGLVLIEKRMVDKVKIKSIFLSNQKSATLYLNDNAPKRMPREIVLFDKLHKNDVIVQTLIEKHPKEKKTKNAPNSRKKVNIGREQLKILAILAIGLLGVFGMIYNSEVGYHWLEGMYFVQVVMIGVLTFVANLFLSKTKGTISYGRIALSWIMLVIINGIHLGYQAYFWLDPNDGPPSIPEFFAEGIVPVAISLVICLAANAVIVSIFKKHRT